MATTTKPRILCVDDEPNILAGLSNTLRRHFDVVTAEGGVQGTEAMTKQGPFAIVMSDFAMPGMNGAQFLAQARLVDPSAVRILLTGQASIDGAIAAVNEGSIFRFLTKPCPPDRLLRALQEALEHARALDADRAVLEHELETMSGHLVHADRIASLSSMAGALGHELNNVLAVLGTAVDFIRQEADSGRPPTAEDLESLDHVKARMTSHAGNLKHFREPGHAGRNEPESDVRTGIDQAVNLLAAAGMLKRGELTIELSTGELVVPLGSADVEHVLLNVLKNAVEASSDTGRRTKISIEVRRQDDRIAVRIADNGRGIAMSDLPFVFEAYFTTKSPDRGTGLGLFVAKQLIERAGGTIAMESEHDVGAVVTITLPLAASARAS
ncbi:MAG: ATP-binding protein [Kofleriaceae bacterium]